MWQAKIKKFWEQEVNRLFTFVILIMITVSVINIVLSDRAIRDKPTITDTPYSTEITSLVIPDMVCPGRVITLTLKTKISNPNTIIIAYQTWFDVTNNRTIVGARSGDGEVRQYTSARTILPFPITATIPYAQGGTVLEFNRGYTAEGAKNYILPITLTISKSCPVSK